MLSELEEDFRVEVSLQGVKYTILIETSTLSRVHLSGQFSNDENSVDQSLINIIIKQAFRDTNLKQIGKTPRFFDTQNFIDMSQHQLKIMQGFKASACASQLGCTLVIDSIFKFQSTMSCLQRMQALRRDTRSDDEWNDRCRAEFVNNSIVADWGN
jgi:hypothetical protein